MRFAFPLLSLFLIAAPGAPVRAKGSACVVKEQTFSDAGFSVGTTRFEPTHGDSRLVIVMPPTGGTTRIDLSYGQAICKGGMAAVVVNSWTDDQEYNLELAIHDRLYRRAQRAIELVLKNSAEFTKIGILGTSIGASHAMIAHERLPRIESVFLIVGGAPIANILATSDQQVLVEGKMKRFEMFGFRSEEEYERALAKVIPFEPLEINPARDERRLGMVISDNDGTVPTKNQLLIKQAWKPALALHSYFGHIGTIVKTWLCDQDQVVKFFAQTLE